jgi:hypothetical protein
MKIDSNYIVNQLCLYRSSHTCDVVVSGNGRVESSTCQERHVFKPFSSANSGATTSVHQSIKLVSEALNQGIPAIDVQSFGQKSSLAFNHKATQDDDQVNGDESSVMAILASFKEAPVADRPVLFTDLVHSLRRLSHSQLVNIFYGSNGAKDNEARKFIFDAIPLLKTDAGITLMRDIIDSGDLSSDTLDAWYATLPFYKNPTRAMIATISVSSQLRLQNRAIEYRMSNVF